jgi:hypothetical protein
MYVKLDVPSYQDAEGDTWTQDIGSKRKLETIAA